MLPPKPCRRSWKSSAFATNKSPLEPDFSDITEFKLARALIQHWLHCLPSEDFEEFIDQHNLARLLERRYHPPEKSS